MREVAKVSKNPAIYQRGLPFAGLEYQEDMANHPHGFETLWALPLKQINI